MNHELAKKLKDAGFSQMGLDRRRNQDTGAIYVPSLSELIKACEWKFACLHAPDKTDEGGYQCWVAESRFPDEGVGDTAEEAVANLWLELNKK